MKYRLELIVQDTCFYTEPSSKKVAKREMAETRAELGPEYGHFNKINYCLTLQRKNKRGSGGRGPTWADVL